MSQYLMLEARLAKNRNRAILDAPSSVGVECEGVEHESELHDAIIAECRQRRLYFVHSRMDRPTTTALGVTDFIVAAHDGRTYWVEAKAKRGKLTPEQEGTLLWLRGLGHRAEVVRSIEAFRNLIA